MEEPTKVSSEDLPNKAMEYDDTTFDGGFVKVEKEGIDTKYDDDDNDEKQVSIERSSSGSQRELQESQEKTKKLELQLEKVTGELNRYESENTLLKNELFSTKEKSEETEKKHEAFISNLEQKLKSSTSQRQEYQEKVTKLESSLNQTSARNSELEDLGNVSSLRIAELEGLFETSQLKLEKAEENLKDLEAFQAKYSSLEASLIVATEKEKELLENLKSAEERHEKQAREIDEANTRNIELEALHKYSLLRIQMADTEVKCLTEKSKDLEEKIRLYEDKLAEASGQSVYLKEELEQSSAENELLADTNNQLKIKIQELEGFLDFEKETATERFNQRDIEVKDLFTKLKSHETLLEEYKRQVLEADTRKMELEEALSKLKTLEETIKELEKENGDLADVNIKINQELANQGSETGDLQTKVSALKAEKDQTEKELLASKTAIENLTNQFTSEGERLQSQISSLAEENNQVNEMYQSTKNELVKLQEQLELEKSKSDAMVSEMEKLNAVAAEKSVLESKFEEVEKQLKEEVEKVAELTSKLQEHELKASDRDVLHKELQDSHTVISEEKEVVSQKYSELEDTLKKSQEELEAKNSMIVLLESLYKELEQKVQLADTKSKKPNLQETESTDKEEVEVKSRDIDLSGNVTIQKNETSHLMTLKIVLGVALVSVIIGIILGKKY